MLARPEAISTARALVVFAIFPALAGCLVEGAGLDRADVAVGDEIASEAPAIVWASPEGATVRPGVPIRTSERDCPVNFLFSREDAGIVFLGTTAYCVRDLPLGTRALVGDGEDLANLIYSSFQTMAEIGESDPDALEYNDLAVFALDRESNSHANPTLPGGGPRGLADGGSVAVGDRLRAFAPGQDLPDELAWRESVVAGRAGEWAILTYSVLPGAPGSLGGPVVDVDGNAVGVFATLGVYPNPGMNGVARLDTMMAYASKHANLYMSLAPEHVPMAS